MKELTLVFLIASIFVATSCINQCSNPEVTAFFNTHMRNIELQFQRTEIVSGKSMLSILILQRITGIESSVQFGDTSVYDSSEDLELDKNNWMLWLDNNICQVSVDSLEAIEQNIKFKYPYFTGSGQE